MTRRKILFVLGLLLVQVSLIWPVYPLFSNIYPLILGIPLSFAWVIIVLFAAFFLLLWYYLLDPENEDPINSGAG